MPKLILIKHASPLVVPGKPPEQWRLSDQGRESCGPLAEKLRGHQPAVVVSSVEPKAIETAEFVAASLGVSHHTAPGLHEHDRSNVPHMRSGEFISMMELFFRRPDELVLGKETASEALARFSKAVDAVVSQHADQTIAIVSHGTVIAPAACETRQQATLPALARTGPAVVCGAGTAGVFGLRCHQQSVRMEPLRHGDTEAPVCRESASVPLCLRGSTRLTPRVRRLATCRPLPSPCSC